MAKLDGLVYVQEIKGKGLSKDDVTAINQNFRNLNQMKQDRNFEVRTATPTTSDMNFQGIVFGNISGASNKRIFVRIGSSYYYVNLTSVP